MARRKGVRERGVAALADLFSRLLAVVFPDRCAGCQQRGAMLCDACRALIPWIGSDVCPACAAPTRHGRFCPTCDQHPSSLDGVRVACRFEGAPRSLIHQLKFQRLADRAPLLGDWVADAVERLPLAVDFLVPIPLAPERKRDRGFNQSALIAVRIGARLGVPVAESCLERPRETPRQVGKSREEREANMLDAFRCPAPEAVSGRRIALVDDVMTTGATLRSAADTLKMAGSARVYGLAVARAVEL